MFFDIDHCVRVLNKQNKKNVQCFAVSMINIKSTLTLKKN